MINICLIHISSICDYLNLFVTERKVLNGSRIRSGLCAKLYPNKRESNISFSFKVFTPISERDLKKAVLGVAYFGHLNRKCSVLSLI